MNTVFVYKPYWIIMSGLLLLLSACGSNSVKQAGELIACPPEPRPQVCTREYRPVCAVHIEGADKTYATGCVACTNPEVTGYRRGACKQ